MRFADEAFEMEAVPQHKDKLSLQPLKKEALTPDDAQGVEFGLQHCRQDALSFFQVLITWGTCLQEQRSKNAFAWDGAFAPLLEE